MRLLPTALVIVLCCIAAAPAPPARPTTKPAKKRVTLLNGTVRMYIPEDWIVDTVGDDQMSLRCTMSDGKSIFSVILNPQDHSLSPREANIVRQKVVEGLTEKFKADSTEVLMKPHSEADKRFLVKIHDRIKEEGHTLDQLHIYQSVGVQLAGITVVAMSDDVQEAKRIHTAAEEVVETMGVGPADKKPAKAPPK